MKMNKMEKFLMNNPIRAAIQRHIEASILEKLGGHVEGLKVLEIGCGQGVGTELLLKKFAAREVHAIDIDPEMIVRAKKRLRLVPGEKLKQMVGDVSHIEAPDSSYDAVFDFAILHHVRDWQGAVREIKRVLKPGGRFYFEEVTKTFLNGWFARGLLDHPKENRFSAEEFYNEVESQGLIVGEKRTILRGGSYLFGVGIRKYDNTDFNSSSGLRHSDGGALGKGDASTSGK